MENLKIDMNDILQKYEKNVLSAVPYRINLVDILGANENAHTRILGAILRYERVGMRPFAISFINRFVPYENNEDKCQRPEIAIQKNYIDALIWEKGKYAIVIENKINWAKDQDKQIETYIEATKEICSIDPKSQCYVIYLTDDGRKKAEGNSLTTNAKKLLGCEDDDNNSIGRYLELNYKDDILPWLKDEVVPNCRYVEQPIITMLLQYIDYLEYRFALNQDCAGEKFDNFLSEVFSGAKKDKVYKELKKWDLDVSNDNCFLGEDNAYVISHFLEQVRRTMAKMIKENYSLDNCDAAISKSRVIRQWSSKNGFNSRKWNKSTFFEFHVGQFGEQRIKFQIDVDSSSNKIWVQFFNNDYDKPNHFVIDDFASLKELFLDLFPVICENEETDWKLCSELGEFNSEEELVAKMEETVKKFLVSFYDFFEKWNK